MQSSSRSIQWGMRANQKFWIFAVVVLIGTSSVRALENPPIDVICDTDTTTSTSTSTSTGTGTDVMTCVELAPPNEEKVVGHEDVTMSSKYDTPDKYWDLYVEAIKKFDNYKPNIAKCTAPKSSGGLGLDPNKTWVVELVTVVTSSIVTLDSAQANQCSSTGNPFQQTWNDPPSNDPTHIYTLGTKGYARTYCIAERASKMASNIKDIFEGYQNDRECPANKPVKVYLGKYFCDHQCSRHTNLRAFADDPNSGSFFVDGSVTATTSCCTAAAQIKMSVLRKIYFTCTESIQ